MHGIGDEAVLGSFFGGRELGTQAAFEIGGDAAGDDHADAAAGALGIVSGHALKAALGFLEARMHGAHQGAVLDARVAEIKR